jgi:colicin import membrane protein
MRIEAKEAPAVGAELAVITAIQAIVPADFFRPGGSKEVLAALKEEVRRQSAALDISTEIGRAAIASLAYKVARSKTALDEQGKKLVINIKAQVSVTDKERGKVWDELDALQKEVRKPLTDWENVEKDRVADHESALTLIASTAALDGPLTLDEIEAKIEAVNQLYARDWEEFKQRAAGAKALALSDLNTAVGRAKEAIRLREEQERQEAEARERAIKEREEAAAKAATEEANRKAAEQARRAREAAEAEQRRVENERIEAEARAKQAEAQRIAAEQDAARKLAEAEEQRKREAEFAEQKRIAAEKEAKRQLDLAEARRVADEQAAAKRAQEAAEQAKREKEAAIEAERQRVATEKRKEAVEAEKRAKNSAHQAAVNREALVGLVKVGATDDLGKAIIGAIAKGEIAHVRIEY